MRYKLLEEFVCLSNIIYFRAFFSFLELLIMTHLVTVREIRDRSFFMREVGLVGFGGGGGTRKKLA